MTNIAKNKNHDEIIKELLHSLQVLKRAKTEYEKSDMELEVGMWNYLDIEFQELFSKHDDEYYIMKDFLKGIEDYQLNDFFDHISPEKNCFYIKKFINYKEMLLKFNKGEELIEKKTKI